MNQNLGISSSDGYENQDRVRACVVWGPVDGRFLVWWVIDNVVWTDSWLRLKVQVAAWLVLVQVKNKRERSLPVRPPGVEKTSRLGSRDPVASGVKCGPHGGKNIETKSSTVFWLSLKTKVESWVVIGGGYTEFAGPVAFAFCSLVSVSPYNKTSLLLNEKRAMHVLKQSWFHHNIVFYYALVSFNNWKQKMEKKSSLEPVSKDLATLFILQEQL
jgi:hypothetical protein